MTDFTLNATGTVNNPWTPAGVIIPRGSIQSDANGFRAAAGSGGTDAGLAHNANYGSTITATATIAVNSSGDDIFLGAVVRTGANAGALIGVLFLNTSAGACTLGPATINETPVSSGVAITRAAGDVLSVTVALSGGVATITASHNGTQIVFNTNTTATFANEASLAAGLVFSPQNVNGTYLTQFTGTGVTGGAAALQAAPTETTAATGAISPASYAPLPLDQVNVDQLFAGSQPNDGTGTPGRFIVIFLKNWAAKLNQMLQQLYGSPSYQQPTTGFAIVLAVGVTKLQLDPAGTLATGTVTFPPNPIDGQPLQVATSQTVTGLTCAAASAPAGQTINGAPTTLNANTSFEYRYRAASNTWYRLR